MLEGQSCHPFACDRGTMAMSAGQRAFTPAETEEYFRLTMKARKCGAWDAIVRRIRNVEDLALDEALSPSLSGSISDGSKRLDKDKLPSSPMIYSSNYITTNPPMSPEKASIPNSYFQSLNKENGGIF